MIFCTSCPPRQRALLPGRLFDTDVRLALLEMIQHTKTLTLLLGLRFWTCLVRDLVTQYAAFFSRRQRYQVIWWLVMISDVLLHLVVVDYSLGVYSLKRGVT